MNRGYAQLFIKHYAETLIDKLMTLPLNPTVCNDALTFAAAANHPEIIKQILPSAPYVKTSAIINAIQYHHDKCFFLLLKHTTIKGNITQVMECACKYGTVDQFTILLNDERFGSFVEVDIMWIIIDSNRCDIFRVILDNSSLDPNLWVEDMIKSDRFEMFAILVKSSKADVERICMDIVHLCDDTKRLSRIITICLPFIEDNYWRIISSATENNNHHLIRTMMKHLPNMSNTRESTIKQLIASSRDVDTIHALLGI
jgi:hypothetical protein